MSIEALAAVERNSKGYKVRRDGFIPAVIYGTKVPSTSIQFVENDVSRYLRQAGRSGKVLLSFNGEEYTGIVKEVQMDPVKGNILHIQIQVADAAEIVNFEVPFAFTGRGALEAEKLFMNVDMPMIKVKGPISKIPENFTVDVSEMKVGDVILVKHLEAIPDVEFDVPEDYVVASVQGVTIEAEDTEDTEDVENVEDAEVSPEVIEAE